MSSLARSLPFAMALLAAACAGPRPSAPELALVAEPDRLSVRYGGRELVALVTEPRPQSGVDPRHARAGYLHPLCTPSGTVVTGDSPASHPHQHGVFLAWTRARSQGREVDFWNTGADQGRVELVRAVALDAEAGCIGFEATLAHVELRGPDGRREALQETWNVRVVALPDATIVDLTSRTTAADSPVEVLEYHYGGFAVRGPEAWEGADGARMLTSDGLERTSGNETRARWVAMTGRDASERVATVAVLAAPTNFRAPEPVRLHPENPYFCFAACQLGPFEIGADPLVARYRIVAMDGEADVPRLEELWLDFTESQRASSESERAVPAE